MVDRPTRRRDRSGLAVVPVRRRKHADSGAVTHRSGIPQARAGYLNERGMGVSPVSVGTQTRFGRRAKETIAQARVVLAPLRLCDCYPRSDDRAAIEYDR